MTSILYIIFLPRISLLVSKNVKILTLIMCHLRLLSMLTLFLLPFSVLKPHRYDELAENFITGTTSY